MLHRWVLDCVERGNREARMKKRWLLGLAVLGAGCDMVLGIEAGVPDTECVSMPADWRVSDQVHGDCLKIVCDGAGKKKAMPDPEDGVDDGNPCTDDVCQGTEAKHRLRKSAPCYTGPDGTESVGQCQAGEQQCNEEGELVGECVGEVRPAAENCYDLGDEDCNGQVNEGGDGCSCVPGTWQACYTGPPKTAGIGACKGGKQECKPDGFGFGACIGEQTPQAEHCDVAMLDEDCDGQKNEEGSDCVCGDGIVQPGEECDDGGTADGDACSATCKEQRVLQVAAGAHHACAILSGGIVKCWGYNAYGQLGLGNPYDQGDEPDEMGNNLPPVDLGTGETATAIAAGTTHTCALLGSQRVKCWGSNDFGQLGQGDKEYRGDGPSEMGNDLPLVDLGTGAIPIAIASGSQHSCALLSTGVVKCWGNNAQGQLGLGDVKNRGDDPGEMGDNLPSIDLGAVAIAANIAAGFQTCALLQSGHIKCWGTGGLLGLGDVDHRGDALDEMGTKLPYVNLGSGFTTTMLSAEAGRTCSILSPNAGLKCWGNNTAGALGLGDISPRGGVPNQTGDNLPFIDLGTGKTVKVVAVGLWNTYALLQDDTVKCWGSNYGGALGLGVPQETIKSIGDEPNEMGDNLPVVELGQGIKPVSIASGSNYACALLDNGSLKCWGLNMSGRLGLGDTEWRGDEPNEMGDNLPTVKLFSDQW